MNIKTFEIIKMLEEKLQTGYSLSIFKGYKAINKFGVEKIIDELYSNLPSDVKQARTYLKSQNIEISDERNSNVYDSIRDLELTVEGSFSCYGYVIVKVKELENLLNKIYKNLPNELLKAKNSDK